MKGLERIKSAKVELYEDHIVVNSTYKITKDGKFFNVARKKELKVSLDNQGYGVIHLGSNIRLVKIHRIIAEYFVENPFSHPYVRHKDGNKSNYKADNLEWYSKMKGDLTGKKFNRLTVQGFSREPINNTDFTKIMWNCLCICGNEIKTTSSELESGHTKSCGCLNSQNISERNFVHGLSRTAEYSVWVGMKDRCFNPNSGHYHRYGGRGITVEEPWKSDFESFLLDMGTRPTDNHTIERVNVHGSYCKDNCVWTDDRRLQAYNQAKRSTNKSGRTGVCFSQGKWHATIGSKHLISTDDYELALFCREEAELFYFGFNKE